MATSFQGTTTKCNACDKTVYLVDKLTADNRVYHKACFRCHHCKGTLKVLLLLPYRPSSNPVPHHVQLRCQFLNFCKRLLGYVYETMQRGDGVSLTQLANYNSFEGVLYCRPHFDQLFKRTGSLDKSFEGTD
jgi:cysteine/glycine-rich protein